MPAALTRIYASFLAGMGASSVPELSLEVARLGFTDCVGVMLAGAQEEPVQRLRLHVLEQGATPRSRMAGNPVRVSAVQAALVNATAAHAMDYDDFAFSNHPSAVLVPTILAVADAVGATGERMAKAYLAGYEVWADLFLREKDLFYDRGWHPTAVLGPIGAAAAAAVVLGLQETAARHALALAASDSGGVFENFGTMAKPWHGGRAAAAGVNAATLAADGLAASASAIEGRHGLLRALSPATRHVVLMHLSKTNNSAALAREIAEDAVRGRTVLVHVAEQDTPVRVPIEAAPPVMRTATQLALF